MDAVLMLGVSILGGLFGAFVAYVIFVTVLWLFGVL
jgi:hypothetical protein